MNTELTTAQARERVIESIAKNMHLYGVTPSIGRIYGTLYFHNEPMTLDELKEELQMSKTSMSTGVRTLIDLNMVEKIWKKGERKDLYQVKSNWHETFIEMFSSQWKKGTQQNMQALTVSIKELEGLLQADMSEEQAQEINRDIEKLKYAIHYYDWLSQVIHLFESREIFSIIKKD